MAAISLQPASGERLQTHQVSSVGSLAPQQVLSEYWNVLTDSSLPAIPRRQRQCEPSSSGSTICALHSQRALEELLWRRFFLDPTLWWDARRPRSRSLRHRESKEVLWLNKFWVDMQLGPPPSTPNSALRCDPRARRVAAEYESDVTAEAVSKMCEKGQLSEAVNALSVLVQTATRVSTSLVYTVLKGCVSQKNLVLGRRVHELAGEAGCESTTFLANHILRMYASHGRLQEVKDVFSKVAKPDAFSWSAVIAAHAKHGEPKQALQLYQKMHISGMRPDCHVFVAALQACASAADVESGKRVHADLLESGVRPDLFVWNCLVDMYAKCGRLEDARRVFDSLATKDVVTCSTMIAGYTKSGRLEDARRVLDSLPTRDVVTCTTMIAGYAKCGRLEDARMLFDSLVTRNVETWNAIIAGYVEHEHCQQAFSLYEQMEQEGRVVANSVTFACLLKGCTRVRDLRKGKQLHSQILERGLESDTVVGTCLVDMYAKCGRLENARTIFDSLVTRNVVTWNAMIAGYAKCGRLEDARQMFDGLVTKNVVTWNTMIAGYAQHERGQEALSLYEAMEAEHVVVASSVTFSCLLNACAGVGALQLGKQLHSQILERGLEADIVVCNCLIHMYEKCGKLEDARRVFDSLPTKDVVTWTAMIAGYAKSGRLGDARSLFDSLATRNVVTWNAMIAGYAEHDHGQEALYLFEAMEQEGLIVANSVTFSCLLKACAKAGALRQGKRLHSLILNRGLGADTFVGNSLVDMYAKCGRLDDACRVFESLPTKDVVTWNAMIHGFGQSNQGQNAIKCFQEMMRVGVQADETTVTCLLVACSHDGLVKEGQEYFRAMVEECGIPPTTEHCNCMVDLLGRAGYLDEAENMLISFASDDVGSMSLLSACRSHRDIERGTRCFERLTRSDPQNAAAYVLMGKIYADAGRWSDVERLERLRKSARANKKPAVAGIEVGKHVHTFVVGEERGDISFKIRRMNIQLKQEGCHVPRTELVLKHLSEMDKEDELCGHAEKLALSYGLLNTPDGTPLLVTKNLRMCADCHSSTEIISRIENREIIVRDAYRVHRFVGGSCHCGGRP